MSNHGNNVTLITARVDKGGINEKSLQSIFECDSDFSENVEYFRSDTLKKGFKNEAERVSTEIFKKRKKIKDEAERLDLMVADIFEVNNFIGQSGHYGDYTSEIIETDFEFIIVIGYVN